jgi:hypothetical protein
MYKSTFLSAALFEVIGQFVAPVSLSPEKEPPRYPLDRRLGGPRTGLDNMEKRLALTLTRNPTPRPNPSQPLAVPTCSVQAPYIYIYIYIDR